MIETAEHGKLYYMKIIDMSDMSRKKIAKNNIFKKDCDSFAIIVVLNAEKKRNELDLVEFMYTNGHIETKLKSVFNYFAYEFDTDSLCGLI